MKNYGHCPKCKNVVTVTNPNIICRKCGTGLRVTNPESLSPIELEEWATEIRTTIDNYRGFYNRKMMMWISLYKKYKKGTYDYKRASVMFSYLTDTVRKFLRENYDEPIPKEAGKLADRWLADEFVQELSYRKNEIAGMRPQVPQGERGPETKKWYNPIIGSYKARSGFGQWSQVLVYKCPKCGEETRIFNRSHGGMPPGAFLCSKCGYAINIRTGN